MCLCVFCFFVCLLMRSINQPDKIFCSVEIFRQQTEIAAAAKGLYRAVSSAFHQCTPDRLNQRPSRKAGFTLTRSAVTYS